MRRVVGAGLVLILAARLFSSLAYAAQSGTVIKLSSPLSMEPPTCAALPAVDPLVEIRDVQRIRLVFDVTRGGYQSWIGSCTTGGLGDAQLVEGPFLVGALAWSASDTFTLSGQPALPGGFKLGDSLAPGLVGSGSGPLVTFPLSGSTSSVTRTGLGTRTSMPPKSRAAGKLLIDWQGIRATVTQDLRDPRIVGVADVKMITYRVDPESSPIPNQPCPPLTTSERLTIDSAPGAGCSSTGCFDITNPPTILTQPSVSCTQTISGVECIQKYNEITTFESVSSYCSVSCPTPADPDPEPHIQGVKIVGTTTVTQVKDGDPVCPPHVYVEAPRLDASSILAGGLQDRFHEQPIQVGARSSNGQPDNSIAYTLTLVGQLGHETHPVLVIDDGGMVQVGQSIGLVGAHTIVLRSGDTVGQVTVKATGPNNTATHVVSMVQGVITLPDSVCFPVCNQGRLKFEFDGASVAGHEIKLVAESIEPATGNVTLTSPLTTTSSEDGTPFDVSYQGATKFRIRASDQTVFATDGTHPDRQSDPLDTCLDIVVGSGGLPDGSTKPGGPANLAAGGVDNDMHRRPFTIRAPAGVKYTLSLVGPASTDGPQAQVTIGSDTLALGGSLPLQGTVGGAFHSGVVAAVYTLMATLECGVAKTQEFNAIGTDVVSEPRLLDGCPRAGTDMTLHFPVNVRAHGRSELVAGHTIEITRVRSSPTTAVVEFSPGSFVSSESTIQEVTVEYRQGDVQGFSLRFSDTTLAPASRLDYASDFRVQPCDDGEPSITSCVLEPPSSDASHSGLPNSASSISGEEQGAGLELPAAAKARSSTGGCKGEQCTDCYRGLCDDAVADPVLISSGHFAEFQTDLGWKVPRGSLSFARTYLSGRQRAGALGAGWSHSFEHRILDRGSLGAALLDPIGNRTAFPPDGAGGYQALSGGGVMLSRGADGGWTLRYRAGSEYRFDAGGRLSEIVDSNGNARTMVYSAAGDLTRVLDGAGGALELEVVDGLIRSATAKNGDKVRFAYTLDRRLAIVTDPAGNATTYSYAPDSGLMTRIQSPVPGQQGLTRTVAYNASSQVLRLTLRTGTGEESVARFEYPDATTRLFTAPDGRSYTFHLDAQRRLAERVDPNGDTYRITRDTDGRPLTRTAPGGRVEAWTYDPQGRVASYHAPGGEVTRVERDAVTGFPTALIRPDGSREERRFDSAGNLVSVKDPLGHETTYTHDTHGQVTAVQEPGGATSRTEYDASGNVSRAIDAAGQATVYERDSLGREIAVTTPGGRTSRTEYCQCGSKSATIDPDGHRTEYKYDALGALIETKLANGATTQITYLRRNGLELVSEVKDAMGNVSKTEYDAVGRPEATVDPHGRRTALRRDAQGRVDRVDMPGGNFVLTRYNAAGLVFETENAKGAITSRRYDANDRVIETIYDDGSTSKQKYDANGRVVERTNAEGGTAITKFDAAGRVEATIDEMGHVNQVKYTTSGAVEKTTNARDKPTRFEQDQLDRVVKTINALGFSSSQEYGPDGEVTLTINARGYQTRFHFNARGLMDESEDALGGKIKKTFDEVENLVRVEDEEHHVWEFKYDLLKRRIRETDPNGKMTRYEFRGLELERVRHADGTKWEYIYDPASGRLTSRVLYNKSGAIEDIESFGYDILGRRTRAENGAVKVTSAYDNMDREVKRTTVWKKTGAVRELTFAWDIMGRRQAMGDSHGRFTRYRYDKLSRPISIKVCEPNPHSTSIADAFFEREYKFTWDAINLVQVDYPNGTRTRRGHDDIDRLTTLVHERVREGGGTELLASWEIKRDPSGNPERVVRENGEEWKFEHDPLDRLVKAHLPRELVARLRAKDPAKGGDSGKDRDDDDCRHGDDEDDDAERLMRSGEITYKYSAAGNRIEENYGGRIIASTYGPTNEMLTRGSMSFGYDELGNQTEKRFKSGHKQVFGYNSAGKLVSLSTGHDHAQGHGRGHGHEKQLKDLERYLYAPDGERVLVEDVKGKQLTHALWDGHRPIEEWHEIGHGSGNGHGRGHAYGHGKKDKGRFYTRGLGGELLDEARYTRKLGRTAHALEDDEDCDDWDDRDEWKRGGPAFKLGHVRFVHGDMLGSSSLITNHRGKVLDRLTYGPWGEPLEGNFARVKFGFTGHRLEERTGHWSALHRQLDPRAGRWTQRDPAGSTDGQNRYSYVRSGPLSATDPLGLVMVYNQFGDYNVTLVPRPLPTDPFKSWRAQLDFDFTVTPNPTAWFKSSDVSFIQVIRTEKDGAIEEPSVMNAMDPEIPSYRTASGFHVDSNTGTPYYPNEGTPGAMHDEPFRERFVAFGQFKFTAQTAAVVRCTGAKSRVVAAFNWEWSYKSTENVIRTAGPTFANGLLPDFAPAIDAYIRVKGGQYSGLPPTY